ncbi:MAG: FHA domain-containing protein [Pirellulaceae bacterium]
MSVDGEVNHDEERARQIVMEVRQLRRAGHSVPDEVVLEQHPSLRELLLEQLGRLRQLERARFDVEGRGTSPAFAANSDLPPAPNDRERLTANLRMTLREEPEEDDPRTTSVATGSSATATITPRSPATVPTSRSPNAPAAPFRPVVRPPMAVIKLYHDGMRSFNHYPIVNDTYRLGRSEGDLLVPHDVRMSSRHAEIQRRAAGQRYRWFLVDLNSTNGTFIRADRALLKDDDQLMIGKEYYRVVTRDGKAGLQHERTASRGETWWFDASTVWLGRAVACPLSACAQDDFVDPRHAFIRMNEAGDWIIKDTGSVNGIWYRVREVEPGRSCSFQLGEQRFGFWLS